MTFYEFYVRIDLAEHLIQTTNLIGAPRSSKLTACVALRCDTRELNCNAVESVPMPLGTATAASSASIWAPSLDTLGAPQPPIGNKPRFPLGAANSGPVVILDR